MKNDYEFIRDSFNADGVQAPEDINEELVAQRLQNVAPVKVKKNKKAFVGIGAASVAGVALITATALLAANVLNGSSINSLVRSVKTPAPLYGTAKLTRFESRGEVEKTVQDINEKNRKNSALTEKYIIDYESADAYAAGGEMGGGNPSYHNSTYVQHTGVDEADTVKTDGKYIYYLSSNYDADGDHQTIEIFSADGKDSKRVGAITGEAVRYYSDFYVRDSRLILLSTSYANDGSVVYTEADIYDVSDPSKPVPADNFRQSGGYVSSRMIGDTLYLVSDHAPRDNAVLPLTGNREATQDEVPAEDIYAVENPSDSSFLVVSSVDTADGARMMNTKAVLGSAEDIYCNQENLYAVAREYTPLVVDGNVWSNYAVSVDRTQIIKISLKEDLEVKASCFVRGNINNQYSLDEYEGNLRVATTSSADGVDVNNLFVLDEKLELLGQVTGFAENESIKAVRYMNDTAYVITYEQTDPLFVIDLSEPSDPTILGAVKISGFSTLLVPLDENTILGVGYNTDDVEDMDMEVQDGIKLVVFDVTDKAHPVVSDTKVFVNYYSAVQNDPKALLVNFERGDYTIPFNCQTYAENGTMLDCYGGTINFRVDDGKLNIVDEYRSETFSAKDGSNPQLDRCVYVGDTIYMVGFVEKAFDASKHIDTAPARQTAIDCVNYK